MLGACKINQQGKVAHPQQEPSPEVCILPVDAQRWAPLSSCPEFSVVAASVRDIVLVSRLYDIFRLLSTIHLPEKGNSFVWFPLGGTAFLRSNGIGFLHVTTWELELVARSSSNTFLELFTPLP